MSSSSDCENSWKNLTVFDRLGQVEIRGSIERDKSQNVEINSDIKVIEEIQFVPEIFEDETPAEKLSLIRRAAIILDWPHMLLGTANIVPSCLSFFGVTNNKGEWAGNPVYTEKLSTCALVGRIVLDVVTLVAFLAGVAALVIKGLNVFFGRGFLSLSWPVTLAIGSLALIVWLLDGLRVKWRSSNKEDHKSSSSFLFEPKNEVDDEFNIDNEDSSSGFFL